MSFELKRKDIKNSYYCVGVAYCDLQYLLRYENKIGYYAGVYGWRGDVYILDNWAICTGYETIQNINIDDKIKRKIIKKYNEKAQRYLETYDYKKVTYNHIKNLFHKWLVKFIEEIRENRK